jgi:hypothetical protein
MNIKLTSPYMTGAAVKQAQILLKQNGFYYDKVDGQFGPNTAHAVHQAKWVFGYPEKQITDEYTSELEGYLSHRTKPGIIMQQRIKSRNNSNIGEKAIQIAGQFEGVSEQPAGSNKVVFSNWYGIIGPWCAMFVTYCMVSAGSKAFEKGNRWAYCPFILADAKAHRNGICIVEPKNMRAGDVVLFDWNLDGTPDHVGMTTSAMTGKTFTTIEGNTSGNNPSDGGMVARNTHDLTNVAAFVRVLN